MSLTGAWNAEYIDEQYRLWKSDPSKVPQDWRSFFEGFELASAREVEAVQVLDQEHVTLQSRVDALIYRYRDLGHLLSCLDPLSACPTDHPLLKPEAFNLRDKDFHREFYADIFPDKKMASLHDIIKTLRQTYCRSVGVEYMHLQDPDERMWLQERMEPVLNQPSIREEEKIRIVHRLYQASIFEQFLHRKYVGQTRFSLEGAEALMPLLDGLLENVAARGCREVILGMAHRGRLNVQTSILGKSYEDIFCEFESNYDPDSLVGAGDVKYHNGFLADIKTASGDEIRVFLANNPSHLESVDPVVEGFARARQDMSGGKDPQRAVMALLIHGDAGFAGQGIVAETLNMSQLEGYGTGGTIHIIINNQIGYTTLPEDARSTRYSTDIAKMLMVPIFHVHGENPEALLHVTKLACDYRMEFGKDVVIDLVCYRRYGHNEGDEPYFTQPLMYHRIKERPAVSQIYGQQLLEEGMLAENRMKEIEQEVNQFLEESLESAKKRGCVLPELQFYEEWDEIQSNYSFDPVETGVDRMRLVSLARKLNSVPEGFSLHRTLKKLLNRRMQAIEEGKNIDWANGEALAFASLLVEGIPVRLSGQDSVRGTFSQRHSALFDIETGEEYVPLSNLGQDQAPYLAYDSLLSEAGVLGFEYGYSLAQPHGLIIWEAQFGDFINNAQAIVDLYLASGQSKWQRLSALVLLLPHGLEGQGPEHSSARLERFLQLCAQDNLQVCNPTTPAQYFHLLRRQVKRSFRKPLVVMTPKSLLRHPLAVSDLSDMMSGWFTEILDDEAAEQDCRRLLFCSGKIYYELWQRRQELEDFNIAIIRLEQLYPFPEEQLQQSIAQYSKAKEWIWVQEEPENMGAWSFVRPRLSSLIHKHISYIGREAAPSPATGFHNIYQSEQAAIIDEAVGPPAEKKDEAKAKSG
jgi:2-oxoglutarate dehydrogenase E1 component